jgi:hypothetical protein
MTDGAWRARLAGALLVGLGVAGPLRAQIDYRNLDDERPLFSEDAYPIERYAFELLVPYRYEAEAGGERVHASVLELGSGSRTTQLGVHSIRGSRQCPHRGRARGSSPCALASTRRPGSPARGGREGP